MSDPAPFKNTYEDADYAAAYARLAFPGTYFLAFRDLPRLFSEHVSGTRALDFGCGAGRTTRFLRRCGFHAVGVDIAEAMVREARRADPAGDYRVIREGDFTSLGAGAFDLVLSAFTFDNIPTMETKVALLEGLSGLLAPAGVIVNLVSSPEIYTHEWASFSTRDFPENRQARCGDIVRIVNTAIGSPVACEDVLWPDEAYEEAFRHAGLRQVMVHRPLAADGEQGQWVNETRIAPWVIHVLADTSPLHSG